MSDGKSHFIMSLFITLILSKEESVSLRTGKSDLSISTATTFFAQYASSLVKLPIPGPISSTQSSLVISDSSAIFSQTNLSVRKFCPKDLEKWNPCLCNMAFILFIENKSIT